MSNQSNEPGTNDYADYDGGLVELGLADPEFEHMLEESDYGAAAPFVPGLTSAMPPILPGGLPLPAEPGPDTPQPRRLA